MKCSNCLLLIRRLGALHEDQAHDAVLPNIDKSIFLLQFSAQGHMTRGSAYLTADVIPTENPPLRTNGKCYSRWPSYPDKASQVLIPLGAIDTSDLSSLKREDAEAWRHKIVARVFASDIKPYMARNFLTILYLEPTVPLIASGSGDEAILSAVRQLQTDTSASDSVCIPQSYRDLLLLHGVLGETSNYDLLAIRHKPQDDRFGSRLAVPQSLLRLADITTLQHRLWSTAENLRSHPLLSESVTEQASQLLSRERPKLHALQGSKWKRVMKAYDSHLTERLVGIKTLQTARRLSEEYSKAIDELNRNARATNDDWLWTSGALTSNPYAWGIVASLRSDLERAGTSVSEAAREMEARDIAIGDYTRDYLAAASASSNMALQRSLFWLTVSAILIALASLLMDHPINPQLGNGFPSSLPPF